MLTGKKYLSIQKPKGKVSFKLVKVNKKKFKKKFSINASTGKLTVKKGVKKGTYKLSVKVIASGDSNYLPVERIVKVKIKVK